MNNIKSKYCIRYDNVLANIGYVSIGSSSPFN